MEAVILGKQMKRIFLILSSIGALLLQSCLQNEVTITLNKDGSGTLVEETTFGEQVLTMLAQFGALGGGEDPLADLISEEKAKERAAALGEGVTFEKAEAVERGKNKGGRVTYRFADINAIRISPGDGMKSMSPGGDLGAAAEDAQKPITFQYGDGKLTIKMPRPEKEDLPGDTVDIADGLANPQMEAMIKEMFADMKVSMKLVIEPGIGETNATHRDGNTITLMELEFGELLKNDDTLKKLTQIDQSDPTAALAMLKVVDGVKFEVNEEVTVTFK